MTQPAPTSCLNLHAAYACEHAGACCTAGWAIPIEEPAYQVVEAHFRGRRPSGALFRTSGSLPPEAAAMLGTAHDGTCVFFEADHGRLCSIHRELGEERLPSACRHFPRVVLHDARGCLISLSHFCPTAARMLFAALPLQIVEAPSSLALNGTLEGLDARDVLPPLLRGDMLADVDGYGAWERSAIATLARNDLTSGQAIARIARATTAIQSWRPGGPSLRTIVEAEFDVASGGEASEDEALDDADADERRVMDALDSIPVD